MLSQWTQLSEQLQRTAGTYVHYDNERYVRGVLSRAGCAVTATARFHYLAFSEHGAVCSKSVGVCAPLYYCGAR
jgi:hypothetical protein